MHHIDPFHSLLCALMCSFSSSSTLEHSYWLHTSCNCTIPMTIVMDVQSCMKATLLAIIILSAVTWLSHMYSCIKTFLESLPSVVSAVIAPKYLFIFSNIIVVYLVSESKLSRCRSKLQRTQKQEELLTEVLYPAIIGEGKQEEENKMTRVVDEEKDAPVGTEDVKTLIVVDQERETSVGKEGVRMNLCEVKVNQLDLCNIHEVSEEVEEGGDLQLELEEEVNGYVQRGRAVEEESEEWDLPQADELNQRVEDFIAKFNMERQLEEARMLVRCY